MFTTKNRISSLPLPLLDDVYRFIWNLLKENNCNLLRIGGISNHIHLLIDLHPSVSLATLINEIKSK
ncbi:MAG: transposase [Duncaniella sp.]|nr:transposase [Duncaniella sp.]